MIYILPKWDCSEGCNLIRFFIFSFLGIFYFYHGLLCHTVASTCNRMIIAIAFCCSYSFYDKKSPLREADKFIVNLIHGSLLFVGRKECISMNSCIANVMIHSVETYSQRWGKRRIKIYWWVVFESSLNALDLVNSCTMKAVEFSTIVHQTFLKQTKLSLSQMAAAPAGLGRMGWAGGFIRVGCKWLQGWLV